VWRYIGDPSQTVDQTRERLERYGGWEREHGYTLWAVVERESGRLVGDCGLIPLEGQGPEVELGYRFDREHWGRGYATEAARAALAFGFDTLGLSEIVALTVPANERSRRVMERLGMTRSPADDFEHPNLPSGHPLRPHVLYRLARSGTTFAISTPSHS
jgi:RimJ/RimL family protein N-acetyltransferase